MLKEILLLLIPVVASCDPLDEAIHALAGKVSVHLTANEAPRLTLRNASSFPAGELPGLRTAFVRAVRRRMTGTPVDIALTVSENIRGYLLIAEVRKPGAPTVEMVAFRPDPPTGAPTLPSISKRLLWAQAEPILDLAFSGDRMLLLEPHSLTSYERPEGKWVKVESAEIAAPPVRDPRARLEVSGPDVHAYFPGATCAGTISPLHLECRAVNSDFTLNGAPAHFTPGRNTIEGVDDRVPACDALLDGSDSIVLYRGDAVVSEPLPVPGPVTALWPSSTGALAVVHNVQANQYAAYALSVDCGR